MGIEIPVIPRILHRGDHLFRTAERFQNVYTVRSGAIKTYVILQSGEEQVIGFHTPGDIVALDAIDSGRYVCNAMVLDTSCVCPLPYEQLCRLTASCPEIQRRLVIKMSRRIVDHEGLLLILGQKTAEQRMAAFLLHHSNRQRHLGLSELDINLPMSRADIASYLALAVETVSRVLTRLQDAGLEGATQPGTDTESGESGDRRRGNHGKQTGGPPGRQRLALEALQSSAPHIRGIPYGKTIDGRARVEADDECEVIGYFFLILLGVFKGGLPRPPFFSPRHSLSARATPAPATVPAPRRRGLWRSPR